MDVKLGDVPGCGNATGPEAVARPDLGLEMLQLEFQAQKRRRARPLLSEHTGQTAPVRRKYPVIKPVYSSVAIVPWVNCNCKN